MSKEDVRARILQVAGAIFAAEGYQNATVRKICAQADVNIAAINYYFGDKEALYVEAVKSARTLIEQRWPLPDWSQQGDADSVSEADERLRALLLTFLRRLLCPQTEAWQMRLLLREIIEPTRAGEELIQEGVRPFFEVLLAILRRLITVPISEAKLYQIGFSIIGQCLFYRFHHRIVDLVLPDQLRGADFQVAALAEHVYHFSRSALAYAELSAEGDLTTTSGEAVQLLSPPER